MLWTVLAGVASLTAADAPPSCASLASALAADRACLSTRHGLIVAASKERAARLAELATTGEQRFALRFGREAPTYAVVEMDGQTVDTRLDNELKARGVRWRLPWLSETATADAFRASITRAVAAKAETMRFDAVQTAALVEAALAQQADKSSPAAWRAKEAGALPHELGHGWLTHGFWPNVPSRSTDHYGGPAPDWMDETAAVLMEDDGLAEARRRQFLGIYDGADPDARSRLTDLSLFLSGGHPALPKLDLAKATPGVMVLTGDEAAKVAVAASTFYLQARLFADYVLARSRNPAAFRSAADAFALGKNTSEWLSSESGRLHLPSSVAALQADWEAWLKTRGGGAVGN